MFFLSIYYGRTVVFRLIRFQWHKSGIINRKSDVFLSCFLVNWSCVCDWGGLSGGGSGNRPCYCLNMRCRHLIDIVKGVRDLHGARGPALGRPDRRFVKSRPWVSSAKANAIFVESVLRLCQMLEFRVRRGGFAEAIGCWMASSDCDLWFLKACWVSICSSVSSKRRTQTLNPSLASEGQTCWRNHKWVSGISVFSHGH